MILTASSNGVETGLQNKQSKVNTDSASSLYAWLHGLQIFQTRLQVRPSCHRLDDDWKRLRGVSDFGQQELGEFGFIDARRHRTYTFDVDRCFSTERGDT